MTANKARTVTGSALSLLLLLLLTNLPSSAIAQNTDNRQQTKNNWRNLAIGAAGASAFGFIKHDPRIGFIGAAGALYSLNRYEQDRKSQSKAAAARAAIFSQKTVYRNGVKYNRTLVTRNGKKYYRLVRA